MARILTEGGEDGTGAVFNISRPEYMVTGRGVRSGAYAFSFAGTLSIAAKAELYIREGFYLSYDDSHNLLRWLNLTTSLGYVIYNSTTKCLDIYTGTGTLVHSGTVAITYGTWYLLEVHVSIGNSGVIEVLVDGIPYGSYSGDTQPSTETTIDRITFGDKDVTFDDIAINDTTGAADNSWCGDGHIIGLLPNANGDSSQLVGNDGNSTDNYLLVDDRPSDSDTTYVYSDTIDEFDLYNLAPCGLTDVNIMRVWTQATAKRTVTESGKLSLGIKSGTTEDWDTEDLLTTTYAQYKGKEYLTDPDTDAAWTVAGVDALQAGIKVK